MSDRMEWAAHLLIRKVVLLWIYETHIGNILLLFIQCMKAVLEN